MERKSSGNIVGDLRLLCEKLGCRKLPRRDRKGKQAWIKAYEILLSHRKKERTPFAHPVEVLLATEFSLRQTEDKGRAERLKVCREILETKLAEEEEKGIVLAENEILWSVLWLILSLAGSTPPSYRCHTRPTSCLLLLPRKTPRSVSFVSTPSSSSSPDTPQLSLSPFTSFHYSHFPSCTFEMDPETQAETSPSAAGAFLLDLFEKKPGEGLFLGGLHGSEWLRASSALPSDYGSRTRNPFVTHSRCWLDPRKEEALEDEGYVSPECSPGIQLSPDDHLHWNRKSSSLSLSSSSSSLWEWSVLSKVEVPQRHSWESYGNRVVPWATKEPPYASESGGDKALRVVWNRSQLWDWNGGGRGMCRVVGRRDFFDHARDLMMGVASPTFTWNQDLQRFELPKELRMQDLSPKCTLEVSSSLLDCGTAFHWLALLAETSGGLYSPRGLIDCAMRTKLRDQLQLHRAVVLAYFDQHPTSVVGLMRLSEQLRRRLKVMKSLCQLEEEGEGEEEESRAKSMLDRLCHNSQGGLGSALPRLTGSLLQACCKPYFRFLEQWMFEGDFLDQHLEFAVRMTSKCQLNGRSMWTGGFILDPTTPTPCFLEGLEKVLLLCGKTVYLLRQCCPQHLFFQAEGVNSGKRTPLTLLLSAEQLPVAQQQWRQWTREVATYLGWEREEYSVGEYLRKVHKEEDRLAMQAKLARERAIHRIKKQREERMLAVVKRKHALMADLKEQVEAVKQRRQEEKEQEAEDDRLWLEELKRKEEQEVEKEKQKKIKSIQMYMQLIEETHQRKLEVEKRINAMKGVAASDTTVDGPHPPDNLLLEDINANPVTVNQNVENTVPSTLLIQGTKRKHSPEEEEVELKVKDEADGVVLVLQEDNIVAKEEDEEPMQISTQSISTQEPTGVFSDETMANSMEGVSLLEEEEEQSQEEVQHEELKEESSSVVDDKEETAPTKDKAVDLSTLRPYQKEFPEIENSLLMDIGAQLHSVKEGFSTALHVDKVSIQVGIRKAILFPLLAQVKLASGCLLQHLLEEHHLVGHLKALQGFFLMQDGEFAHTISLGLYEKVSVEDPKDILAGYFLNSLLSNAVMASASSHRPFGKHLDFHLEQLPQLTNRFSLEVSEWVSLYYRVEWPMNIIITEEVLKRYKEVFSFLLRLKGLSWILRQLFHKLMKAAGGRKAHRPHPLLHEARLSWQQLEHLSQSLQGYVATSLLQDCQRFWEELAPLTSLDQIYSAHVRFLRAAYRRCLLSRKTEALLKVIKKSFCVAVKFLWLVESQYWHEAFPESGEQGDESAQQHLEIYLHKLREALLNLLRYIYNTTWMLSTRGNQSCLSDLLSVFDFSGFYESANIH